MAWVVFMRAVNVGGHQVLKPTELATELAAWDVVSVGAAGTFVVRKAIKQSDLREELRQNLPFEAPFMICRASDFAKLIATDPFRKARGVGGLRHSVSILAERPSQVPRLPMSCPAKGPWQVRILGLLGRFALVLWRRTGKAMIYPNAVVEKELGVAATTRTWETLVKVYGALQSS